MKEVIHYHDIQQKRVTDKVSLSDEEALIRALDLLDFLAVLSSQNEDLKPQDDEVWIELKYKNTNDQQRD